MISLQFHVLWFDTGSRQVSLKNNNNCCSQSERRTSRHMRNHLSFVLLPCGGCADNVLFGRREVIVMCAAKPTLATRANDGWLGAFWRIALLETGPSVSWNSFKMTRNHTHTNTNTREPHFPCGQKACPSTQTLDDVMRSAYIRVEALLHYIGGF